MKAPLKPGASWQTWTIQQVLSWGQGGGLYRVVREQEKRLLKELILPPLAAEARAERMGQLKQALTGWRELKLPQAIALEEVSLAEDRLYLLLPELPGQPLSLEAPARAAPPPEEVLLKWAAQICDLVLALQTQKSGLALSLLEPDHILRNPEGDLVVINPGWSQLAAAGAEKLQALSPAQGLHKFARLMVFCATGAPPGPKLPPELPPAFLWMVSRCLQDEYTSFSQVRQSLQAVALEETRSSRSGRQSLDEFSIADMPAPPPARPLSRRFALGAALLSLLAVLGLGLALRRGQAKYAHPPGLALARQNRLQWLSPEGAKIGENALPQNITCMLASPDGERVLLGLEGQGGISLVDRSGRQLVQVEGGATPTQLLLSSDGQRVVGLLRNGNLGSWKLAGGTVHWQGEVSWSGWTRGARLTAVRDDAGVLAVLPGRGLALFDAQGSEERTDSAHPGVSDAFFLDQLMIAVDSRQALLLALQNDFQPISQQTLPGLTRLYRNSYRRQVWGVEQRGLVTLWSAPALAPLGRLQLPGAPLCAAPDPLGHLWTVTQSGRLCKLDSQPLSCQQLGQVGPATALVYLAQPLPPTGLKEKASPSL